MCACEWPQTQAPEWRHSFLLRGADTSPWVIKLQTIWWILPYLSFKRHKYSPAISLWAGQSPCVQGRHLEARPWERGGWRERTWVSPFTQSKHYSLCQERCFTCHILPARLSCSSCKIPGWSWHGRVKLPEPYRGWEAFFKGVMLLRESGSSVNHKTNVHCKLRQNQPGRKLCWLNFFTHYK